MRINITDDFDIKKIAESGQCFRIKQLSNGKYRAITGKEVVYIEHLQDNSWSFECSKASFDSIWFDYFDLGRNYADIRNSIPDRDSYMKQASDFSNGIRILRQNVWEMLISFIISQRKSIPAIKTAIEILAAKYGEQISTPYETVHSFPAAETLKLVSKQDLELCGLGYRASYIIDAIQQVNSGAISLENIPSLTNSAVLEKLKKIHGVGDKVANCILLFGFARVDCTPVDVWISRTIENEYQGINPFDSYPGSGGIMQQYMFYYARKHKI